ncbi:hypothetical protein [Planosporangium mesophilum]|uniref:hypothetical protein n=1 Tax=Planosporangium mesophilum TaxID=689768 RepID=UPI00143A4DC6|nr:hypothetical protein [Planosporangium mesophilum]NJC82256.1 hypothetical protein [Planosporangium mesophilum]
MNARRDRTARTAERSGRQSDRPVPRVRSDAAGWSTISPAEDRPSRTDDRALPSAERSFSPSERSFSPSERSFSPSERSFSREERDDLLPEPRSPRSRYSAYPESSDDEPRWEPGTVSRRDHDDEPVRPYRPGSWPSVVDDPEPRRSRRSEEEGPRRSRRAEEQAALRALPASTRPRIDPLDLLSDSSSSWNGFIPASSRSRDQGGTDSWRPPQPTGIGEDPATEAWRAEPAPWRSGTTIDLEPGDISGGRVGSRDPGTARFGTRAIGSAGTPAEGGGRHADSDLETWRSETGTWRARDTATTGSWRRPPSFDEDLDGGDRSTETGSWSSSRGEWVPRSGDTGEQPSFSVRRYDDTGEIPRSVTRAIRGREDDYRVGDSEPSGRRALRSRYDDEPDQDDAPRYRSGRHAVSGYDDEEEWPPRRSSIRTTAYAGPRSVAGSTTQRAVTGRGETVDGRRETPTGRREPVRRPAAVTARRAGGADDVSSYRYVGAALASVGWFGLPIGAFLLWAVLLGSTAQAGCVTAAGQPCPAPRDAAFQTFQAHLPELGIAIVLSAFMALLIRWVSPFWRSATVGFAAAVVGAGIATILYTVVNTA